MRKFELVFIPGPGMGHLACTLEMANFLVSRDDRLSITVLVMKIPSDTKLDEYIQSLSASFAGKSIRLIVLPEPPLLKECRSVLRMLKTISEIYKPYVSEAVAKLTDSQTCPDSPRLVGFVIDMFCTPLIDVAKEYRVPCYVFFTSCAGFLAFIFHLQELYDQNNSNEAVEQLQNSSVELALPSFVNPIPGKIIPSFFFDKDFSVWFYDVARKFRTEIKGILINTFIELESHVLKWMSSSSSQIPLLYPIGPILNLKNTGTSGPDRTLERADIMKWLDDQPQASVIFLCFGSKGSFDEDQVQEIAQALERSGVRFLWSLRQPPPKGKFEMPRDYTDIKDVLPEGFLEHTAGIGRVIGWAPQVEILAHPATGGFVSHCGWNSTLESLWHGVPMTIWPMYAEQQLTAFEMVVELGLAVDITLDYQKNSHAERSRLVSAEEIESGIRKLMEKGDEIKKKVKAKGEESRKSVVEGGSSFISLGRFIDDVLANSPEGKD